MITYHEDVRMFVLDNGSMGYAIYVNDAGYLETVYFGRHMADYTDVSCMRDAGGYATPRYLVTSDADVGYADGFKADCAPLECSPHALTDKRGAPLIVRDGSGSYVTDFRYDSYTIEEGTPDLEELPHAHGENAETLDILLKDRTRELWAHLVLTIFEDKDVLVKSFSVENGTDEAVRLTRAMSMQLDLPRADYDLVHFRGRWAKERDYTENAVVDGVQEVSSNLGRSSAEENPFVYLKERHATMEQGEVIGFNLIYSGNFKFRTFVGPFRGLHITYGIND